MTAALTDDEIEDRFFITNPRQIIAMLGQFIYRSIPVTVQFNGGSDFILTTLLEARSDTLIFDMGGDTQANQRLLKSNSCTFITATDGIRVQFPSSGGVKQIVWDDSNALAVKLPTRLIRLQRREAYRIKLPTYKSVTARLIGEEGEVTSRIHNISISGLGFTFSLPPHHKEGETIKRITFGLADQKEINCKGDVRHVTEISDGTNKPSYRMGISFKDLPRPMETALQRYIISIELDIRKMSGDLD